MRAIFTQLYAATKLLVPTKRYRWQLMLLVVIAASIPVTELLVAKLFTDLVIAGSSRPISEIILQLVLFAVLFVSTRTINYLQKTYRVKFFDKAFGADTREKSSTKESWEWALGLELVNVLSFLTQAFVIAAFFKASEVAHFALIFAGIMMASPTVAMTKGLARNFVHLGNIGFALSTRQAAVPVGGVNGGIV